MFKLKIFVLAVLLSGLMAQLCLAGDVALIANNSVSEGSLDRQMVQKIFLGKKSRWSDKTKIVPAMLKSGSTRDTFLNDYVKKSPSQFENFWNQAIFTGKGTPPKTFASEKELVSYVAATAGAVGFVSSGTSTAGVKKISIK